MNYIFTPDIFDPDKAFGSLVRRFGMEHPLIIAAAKMLQAKIFDYETYHEFGILLAAEGAEE